jgi:hypothetical protein
MRRERGTGATGLEPATSGVTGRADEDAFWRRTATTPAYGHILSRPIRGKSRGCWGYRGDVRATIGPGPSTIETRAAQLGHADGGVLALRVYVHADPLESADFIDEALRG